MSKKVKKVEKSKVTLSDGTTIKSTNPEVDFIKEFDRAYLDVLTKGKSDSPYIFARILERDVVRAMAEPNSQPAQFIRKNAPKILKRGMTAQEIDNINEQKVFKVWQIMSQKQQQMIFDGKKKKLTIAARRAGKTFAWACLFWITYYKMKQEDEHRHCLYIEKSITKGYQNIWDAICQVGQIIGDEAQNHGGEYITFGDSLTLWIGGFSNVGDIDKFRGKRFSIIIIDEVQTAKSKILEPLIKQVLLPTQATYNKKYIWYDTLFVLSGTPDYFGAAAFIRSFYNNPEWEHYKMTLIDNPSVEDPIGFVEEYLKFSNIPYEIDETKMGLDRFICDDVAYRKEILGDITAEDLDTVIFKNVTTIKPEEIKMFTPDAEVICGIDFGFTDMTAITLGVLDWDQDTLVQTEKGKTYTRKKLWILKSEGGKSWGSNQIKEKIQQFAAYGQDIYLKLGRQNKCIRFFADHNNPATVKDANIQAATIDFNFLGETGKAHTGAYVVIPAIKTFKAQSLYNMKDYLKQGSLLLAVEDQNRLIYDLKEAKWQKEDGIILSELDDSQWSSGHGDYLHSLLYLFNSAYRVIYGADLERLDKQAEEIQIPTTDLERFMWSKR